MLARRRMVAGAMGVGLMAMSRAKPAHAVGMTLNQLPKWVPDAMLRKTILVDNPARL
jgi:hypothetical protein